jgi:hypothetical protein
MRALSILCLGLAAAAAPQLGAATHGLLLGTAPPPAFLGGIPVIPFDLAPQEQIPDHTEVLEIPGAPTGPIPVNDVLEKLTVPTTFPSWSHGYTGPVFAKIPPMSEGTEPNRELTLPAGTRAFYLYLQVVAKGPENVSVRSGDAVLGAVVDPDGGATGFAFYTDDPDEFLSEIVINRFDFGLAELGIGGEGVPVELLGLSVE